MSHPFAKLALDTHQGIQCQQRFLKDKSYLASTKLIQLTSIQLKKILRAKNDSAIQHACAGGEKPQQSERQGCLSTPGLSNYAYRLSCPDFQVYLLENKFLASV